MDDLEPVRATFGRPGGRSSCARTTGSCAWLYLGTFGSFIGFSAGLSAAVAELEFTGFDVTPYVFLGPLVAALAAARGRLAGRPRRRCPRRVRVVHGRWRWSCSSCSLQSGGGRMAGGVARVPGPVFAAVRRQRRRQRRDVPDDPRGVHRRREAVARRRGRRRRRARCARARWRARRRWASPRRSPPSAASSSPRPTAPPSRLTGGTAAALGRSSSSTSRAWPSPGGSTCTAARTVAA